ncbi:hypothetical protein GGC64_005888 [Mycobacterium sp. OAS707]|nr:hypothetical protein [Mycobacterium sp. OAS707]
MKHPLPTEFDRDRERIVRFGGTEDHGLAERPYIGVRKP